MNEYEQLHCEFYGEGRSLGDFKGKQGTYGKAHVPYGMAQPATTTSYDGFPSFLSRRASFLLIPVITISSFTNKKCNFPRQTRSMNRFYGMTIWKTINASRVTFLSTFPVVASLDDEPSIYPPKACLRRVSCLVSRICCPDPLFWFTRTRLSHSSSARANRRISW